MREIAALRLTVAHALALCACLILSIVSLQCDYARTERTTYVNKRIGDRLVLYDIYELDRLFAHWSLKNYTD